MSLKEGIDSKLTIREHAAKSRLWVYLFHYHKLKLSDAEISGIVLAVDQYKMDLVNGMSKKEIENY